MQHAIILAACRTSIGKFHGGLSALSAPELGAAAIRASLERAGVATDQVDEVIFGNVLAAGVGQAPARQAALKAGLPPAVAAVTINKVCGSGLKAIMLATQAIRSGDADVVVAGGMESMSRAPYLLSREGPILGDRTLADAMLTDGLLCPFSGRSMGQIAEALAKSDGITREAQDRYACESHRRAVAAQERGAFNHEIASVTVRTHAGHQDVTRDEGPRVDTTLAKLSSLRPVFTDDGTVTAGNSSMISDGAAAVVVASEQFAKARGLTPLARVVASATSGTEPGDLFIAPVAAIRKVLSRAAVSLDDVDLVEINEAFAAQMLACLQRLDLSPEKANVSGGAIALGHPLGASGARITATVIHALRERQQRLGLAALCLGGGNAVAALFERI